jgi:hypothetical protein
MPTKAKGKTPTSKKQPGDTKSKPWEPAGKSKKSGKGSKPGTVDAPKPKKAAAKKSSAKKG